jgi:hypothetical protein
MFDAENSRLKNLLVATTTAYVFGWGIGLFLTQALYDDNYLIWLLKYPWLNYVTGFFVFLGFCWIPLSIFLLVQGVSLRRQYSLLDYTGDRTVGNLSTVLPVFFFAIYIATRVLN